MVERRVDEQLECERRPSALASEQRDCGREIAAGAGAADCETIAIQAELGAVLCDPARRRVAVLESGGERTLWGSAICDRDDRAGCCVREPPADRVDRRERAERPASAEEEDQHGRRAHVVGQIEAHWDLAIGTRRHALENAGDGLWGHRRGLGEFRRTCLGDRELMHRARPCGMPLAPVCLDLWVEPAFRHHRRPVA